MSLVSTQRDDALGILGQEARFLVQLGPRHPERAQQIGRLIVAYHRLITALKDGAFSQHPVAEGADLQSPR